MLDIYNVWNIWIIAAFGCGAVSFHQWCGTEGKGIYFLKYGCILEQWSYNSQSLGMNNIF